MRGSRPAAGRPVMLITLCYLYLWARWGRRPAALVRATVQRLRASRCSFTFCGAAARPRDARVCLSRGGRVFCVGESQVGGRGAGGVRAGPGARGGRGRREARPRGSGCRKRRPGPRCAGSLPVGRSRAWGPEGGLGGASACDIPGSPDRGPEVRNCCDRRHVPCPRRAGSGVWGGMAVALQIWRSAPPTRSALLTASRAAGCGRLEPDFTERPRILGLCPVSPRHKHGPVGREFYPPGRPTDGLRVCLTSVARTLCF